MPRTARGRLIAVAGAFAVLSGAWDPLNASRTAPAIMTIPAEDTAVAQQLADSLLLLFNAPVDSLVLANDRQLHVALRLGSYRPRVSMKAPGHCIVPQLAGPVFDSIALLTYRLYGRNRQVERIVFSAPGDRTGFGPFSDGRCRTYRQTQEYSRRELEPRALAR